MRKRIVDLRTERPLLDIARRMHLRQKLADVPGDFRVSFAFEHIVDGIPALLEMAHGLP
jgi:hypothetical protein